MTMQGTDNLLANSVMLIVNTTSDFLAQEGLTTLQLSARPAPACAVLQLTNSVSKSYQEMEGG